MFNVYQNKKPKPSFKKHLCADQDISRKDIVFDYKIDLIRNDSKDLKSNGSIKVIEESP